ncbi:MAG: 30S ribosome-binding factor RbfA [Candidatus Omnitrophota bacterium]|nr:30S ribosome-binding factor RbfA [Candidatus Omnitrophota bacterium]
MSGRMNKVSETIKRHVSFILQEEISDPRIGYVTVTRVEVSKDLRLAKVFYVTLDEMADKHEVLKGLKSAADFVRGELAKRMSIKFIPKLSFREDIGEKKEHLAVDEIFEILEKERQKNKTSEEEG